MNPEILAILVLFGTILGTRWMNDRANQKLSIEQKAKLVDLFSKTRIWNFALLFGIVILYFIVLEYGILEGRTALWVYALVVTLVLIVVAYLSSRKLKENGFPDDYVKSYLTLSTLRMAGLLIFFLLISEINK
jgi:uncharacterized membrane protein